MPLLIWLGLHISLAVSQHFLICERVRWAYRVAEYNRSEIATILLWYATPFSWLIIRPAADWRFLPIGFGLILSGNLLATWAMRCNPHCRPEIIAPPKVIRTGAYRVLNHPLYVGCVLQGIGSLLFLNNLLGVAPLAVYAGILWGRARREDAILRSLYNGSNG